MSSVSPWFYTHYGPESFNKNWIFRSDDWLYNTRWEKLVEAREKVDIVQIISWNGRSVEDMCMNVIADNIGLLIDYGESHYIGPIEGAQPNSNAWVDGFDHQGEFFMSLPEPFNG